MRATAPGVAPTRAGLTSTASAGAGSALLGVLGVALIVGVWWLIAAGGQAVRLPTPAAVSSAVLHDLSDIPALRATTYQRDGLLDALLYTTRNVVFGVAVGIACGLATGVLMARRPVARGLLEVPLLVVGTMPVLILLPFLVLWFGTSRLAQAGLVIVYTFVTVTVVAQNACTSAARRYEEYALSLGASRRQVLREVLLPAITPDMIAAVRVAFAAGWGLEAVAELIGGSSGAGQIIQAMANLSRTADVIGAVICIGIVGIAVDGLVQQAGKWVVRWQE